MADLIDFLEDNDDPSEIPSVTRYSPQTDGDAFIDAEKMLEGNSTNFEELLKSSVASKFYIPGDQGDGESIVLKEYEIDCALKLPFMSKHGTVGPNAKFPHIGSYPEVPENMSDSKKESCYGEDWNTTAYESSQTFLTIGSTASSWDLSDPDISPSCSAQILVKEIGTKTNQVSFPNLVQLEADEIKLHSDKDVAIEITENKVTIHPLMWKSNLNIHTCKSDFKMKSKSQTPQGEVFHSDKTADCIVNTISQTAGHGYSASQFSYLIEKK